MVKFKLIEETDAQLIYWYYPEGNYDGDYGIIMVDRINETIEVTKVAEDDWERDIPTEEINELIEAINKMRAERGSDNLEELVTEPEHSIYYADHAVHEIAKRLREGEIPKEGMQAWY